jgi:AcrR family transcriptional regulator
MLAAVFSAVAAKGYGSTTIGDITGAARVSRDTFYQQFAGKEECFLAAYDATTRELLDRMVAAGTSQPGYVEGMREGVHAYLEFWSERPEAARAWMLEVMAAGSEALAHREQALRSFERLYRAVAERAQAEHPDLPSIPDVVARAIVVGAVELTAQYVRENRLSSLPDLESDVLYMWLMVVAGHEVAAAARATYA